MNPHVVETGDSEKKKKKKKDLNLTDLIGRRKKNQSLDTSVGCKMELFNFFMRETWEVKTCSCSTQLSMKFSLLINMKMPTAENANNSWHFHIH